MGIDAASLRSAVAAHGRIARVSVAAVSGSAPREVGASMLVWPKGQSGTIGGGALEFDAAKQAFARQGATRHALGPALGQCCGGAVTLWTEQWDVTRLRELDTATLARGPGAQPLSVTRLLDRARGQGNMPETQLVDGWFIEPVDPAPRALWIWGAGHVGRALVEVLAPLPDFALTWVDTAAHRFPESVPDRVRVLPATDPTRAIALAPQNAGHLVLTYSHRLDLGLCDGLLRHGFGWAGLIGSETKWARFQRRLAASGHLDAEIRRICCPIGQKTLGKHPQAIAVGVAAQLLQLDWTKDTQAWTTSSYSLTA